MESHRFIKKMSQNSKDDGSSSGETTEIENLIALKLINYFIYFDAIEVLKYNHWWQEILFTIYDNISFLTSVISICRSIL